MVGLSPGLRRLPGGGTAVRWCALLTTATLLVACSDGVDGTAEGVAESGREDDRPLVLTTFTVLEDMASAVAGDRVEVRSIAPRGAEIHEYDPRPSDLRAAAEADLILSNGFGLEAWYGRFLDQVEARDVTVTRDVAPLPVTRIPGHPESDEDLPENPHAWMSPTLAQQYVTTIEEELTALSPEDAEHFSDNADRYREELQEIRDDAADRLAALDSPVHLVTCEGAFSYLAEDLDLREHYLWPVNAGAEGTPQQVETQTEYVIENDVPTVFCESTVNDAAQQQVAEAADASLGEPLHVDSLTEADGPAPTVPEMIRHTVEQILDGVTDDHGDPDDGGGSL